MTQNHKMKSASKNAHTIKPTARVFTGITVSFGIGIFLIFLTANLPQVQKIIPYSYQLIISVGLYMTFREFWKIRNIISPPFRSDYLRYGFFTVIYTLTLLFLIFFGRESLWFVLLIAIVIAPFLIQNISWLYGLFIEDMQWKERNRVNVEKS